MERQPIFFEGWPALMPREMAARYLCVDEDAFCRAVSEHGLDAVEIDHDTQRWKKADLDRLIKRLPSSKIAALPRSHAVRLQLGDVEIERLAIAIAKHIGSRAPQREPELVSIKEASRLLGLGRTTVYQLITEGRLETRRIGRRNLITKSAIEALLADQ
jgi:excisionase family DNA binding protein